MEHDPKENTEANPSLGDVHVSCPAMGASMDGGPYPGKLAIRPPAIHVFPVAVVNNCTTSDLDWEVPVATSAVICV
jgi:hypothetical protein